MADDITLTVRVRDLTRGDFEKVRQRMRGMDGDIRRVAQSSDLASDRAERLSKSIRGTSDRLGQLQRSGSMARSEMDHMRRSMSLASRDLANAARNGEITGDQFRALRNELERTRLDFDYLDNDLRRHSAVAQAAHRAELLRQREAAAAARQRMREEAAAARQAAAEARRTMREEERRLRERARMQEEAARRRAREEARAEREAYSIRTAAMRRQRQQQAADARERMRQQQEERRREMDAAGRMVAQQRRVARAHDAALREEMMRNRRAEAERQRAAAAAATAQQRDVARLAALSGRDAGRPVSARVRRVRQDNQGLTLRFRALGENDMNRMTRGFARLQGAMAGVSGSSARARRTVRALDGDLRTMARALQEAGDAGSLSRRDFNALSNGLRTTIRDARLLQQSEDLTRSSFRDMRSEVTRLQAQLRLLGREGNAFNRLSDRTMLLQRRLRDTRTHAGVVRRSLSRLGEGGLGGLRLFTHSLGRLGNGLGRVRAMVSNASRGMKMFLLILGLIGPLAAPVGALLTTVLGGAFVALGAFALRSEKDIRAVFGHMKSTIGSTVRAAAQPLRSALIVAMREVTVATREMGGALTAAFTATAPLVSNLVGGFTDLAARALPGFVTALQDMGPVIEGFRDAMGMIGEGIGDMFAAMTSGGGAEGLAESWRVVGDGLRDVLVNIGQFISSMSQSETATTLLKTAFGALSGILIVIEGAFKAVDAVLGPVIRKMDELGLTGGALGILATVLEGLGVSSGEVRSGLVELKGAQDGAAASAGKHAGSITDLIDKISALNDLNRSSLDARSNQERVINEATKEYTKYGEALKYSKGQLDLTTESSQKAYGWLSQIAAATKESTDAAIKSNAPWKQVQKQWQHGYDEVVKLADGMGLSKEKARLLADQIIGIPNKEIFLQARTEQVKADLDSVIAAMQTMPNEETITVKTLTADSVTALKNLGFVVEQLPDGSFTVTAKTGTAEDNIGRVQGARDALKGKNVTMSATDASTGVINAIKELIATLQGRTVVITTVQRTVFETFTRPGSTAGSLADAIRKQAKNARGGATGGLAERLRGFADGGGVTGDVLDGPGTKTSDGLFARLSRGEFVMRASAVDKYGPNFMKKVNEGRFPRFAKGGVVSEAKQARGPIKAATSGTTEKNLLRLMNSIIKHTIKMATALKQVNSALEKAKSKLSSLKSESSSLSSSVKSGVLSATNVTSGVESGKHVTVASIMGGLTAGRDKSKAFASALSRLRKKGLNKTLLRQIAEAGIGGGGLETAGALLTASGSEFRSVNSLQSQISKSASSAGKTTASALYSKQIKTQEKLVKSLDELSKALKKATAKRKKKAVGGPIGAASGGARGGLTWVGEEGPELVRLPYGASVSSNSDSRRIAGLDRGPGSSSGGPSVINVYIGEKKVDEIILDSNRRTVRTRGGNVQAAFGRKNG